MAAQDGTLSGPDLMAHIAGGKAPFAVLPVLNCGAFADAEGPARPGVATMSRGLVDIGEDYGTPAPPVDRAFAAAAVGTPTAPTVAPVAPRYMN